MRGQKENGVGRVVVDVDLSNYSDRTLAEAGVLPADQVRKMRVRALVDPGASLLVLPAKVAKQLGLRAGGTVSVTYADRRKATRQVVKGVQVDLLGRDGISSAIVEPKRENALIGSIVLEALDLLVDCRKQILHPLNPRELTAEVE